MKSTAGSSKLDWLLNEFVSNVPAVRQSVILSRDGITMAASENLTREDAEHLSALAAGLQGLARGAGRHFNGGRIQQTVIEMESFMLFVTAAGDGSCLAVLCDADLDADAGQIAYEMTVLVKRVGAHLEAAPRQAPVPAHGLEG
ncbi:roadblock/LC7 domain-containing protein [Actinocorallia longicatena]|uniref:Roadblock/LC7 domain-containing protein n=1 Tax=Actinocorallia longicatena TaxID=111803 RepID=A0ABP6Q8M5_9ACTN